jgi:hypothetical protein
MVVDEHQLGLMETAFHDLMYYDKMDLNQADGLVYLAGHFSIIYGITVKYKTRLPLTYTCALPIFMNDSAQLYTDISPINMTIVEVK